MSDLRPRDVSGTRVQALRLFVLALAVLPSGARADVFHLKDGDRVSGRTVSAGARSYRVQTPYGFLTIPRSHIAKIVHDDGREEVVNSGEGPSPAPTPEPPPPLRLMLTITGHSFWRAWDPPRGTSVDPTLRLEVGLDDETVATYVDARTDPEEIPGAIVNVFTFGPEDVTPRPGRPAGLLSVEPRLGRIDLGIELPGAKAGPHRLHLSYQANEGTGPEPEWREVAGISLTIGMRSEEPTVVRIHQDRGRMEFSGPGRRRMKHVETFGMDAQTETGGSGPAPALDTPPPGT